MSQQPQKKDEMFAATASRNADFEFNEQVAEVFDDMLARSVPFYAEQQWMIREIAKKFWVPGTNVYDLGCSTGTTLAEIGRDIGPPAQLIGIDNSEAMLERARLKLRAQGLEERITLVHGDLNGDLAHFTLKNASVVTLCWTLQFIRPLRRDNLIRWIYDGMVEDGVLVVAEKVLTANSHTNRFFIDLYYDFKRRNGYSDTEIARKREALENVLVPYRLDENLEMFRRNGFEIVDTFFQWYNFVAFLCVKKRFVRGEPGNGHDR
jgi:tRNA (cmo5U34)-methyltransferase